MIHVPVVLYTWPGMILLMIRIKFLIFSLKDYQNVNFIMSALRLYRFSVRKIRILFKTLLWEIKCIMTDIRVKHCMISYQQLNYFSLVSNCKQFWPIFYNLVLFMFRFVLYDLLKMCLNSSHKYELVESWIRKINKLYCANIHMSSGTEYVVIF